MDFCLAYPAKGCWEHLFSRLVVVIPVYGQNRDWGEDRHGLSGTVHQAGDSMGLQQDLSLLSNILPSPLRVLSLGPSAFSDTLLYR